MSRSKGCAGLAPNSRKNTERQYKRILVVDDHDEIRLVLGVILESAGFEVAEAASGQSVLTEIRDHRPDLILLEPLLRDIDGYAIIRSLKDDPDTRAIPIVVVSALSDPDSRQLSLELGAVAHITKPWESGAIETAVKRALAGTSAQ